MKKWNIIDEGAGRLRFKVRDVDGENRTVYGIYEQNGDHLKIYFSNSDKSRPTQFEGNEHQCLLVLHRVKSRQ